MALRLIDRAIGLHGDPSHRYFLVGSRSRIASIDRLLVVIATTTCLGILFFVCDGDLDVPGTTSFEVPLLVPWSTLKQQAA